MINLYTELNSQNGGNVTPGGEWTLGTTAPVFPCPLDVDGTPASYNTGDVIGVNDNPQLDFTGLAIGDYEFIYTVESTCIPLTASTDLLISVYDVPNEECATGTVFTWPNLNGESITIESNLTQCASISSETIPPSWPGTTSGDVWFTTIVGPLNNVAYFTITGIDYPLLEIWNGADCVTKVSFDDYANMSNILITPQLAFSPGDYLFIRIASGNLTNLPYIPFSITLTTI